MINPFLFTLAATVLDIFDEEDEQELCVEPNAYDYIEDIDADWDPHIADIEFDAEEDL